MNEDERYKPFLLDIDFHRVHDVLSRCLRETYLNKLRKEDLRTPYVGLVPDFNPLDMLSPKEARNTTVLSNLPLRWPNLPRQMPALRTW